jgi:hypothetical protein
MTMWDLVVEVTVSGTFRAAMWDGVMGVMMVS